MRMGIKKTIRDPDSIGKKEDINRKSHVITHLTFIISQFIATTLIAITLKDITFKATTYLHSKTCIIATPHINNEIPNP
jgi:hypothetical protein